MTQPSMGPTGEPFRSPLMGPAVPHRSARATPGDAAGGALPPYAPRRAQAPAAESAPAPAPAAPPTAPAPAPQAPAPAALRDADPYPYIGGVQEVELDGPAPRVPDPDPEPYPIADLLVTELSQSETLEPARVPEALAMSEEIGRVGELDSYAEVADRLERIARALRDGGPGTLLASGDPLTSLILGFAMGLAEGSRPTR